MDGSGKLEYTEFCVACIDRSTLLTDQNLELSFKMFDTTGSGQVTTKDLKHVFSQFNLHDRVIQDLMK
jgi:calcium-dependent protein kinase